MKKILLSLLLVFGSLNMFAQDNGWKKKTSPITGESWVQKSIVNEMGESSYISMKIWKHVDGSYLWTVITDHTGETTYRNWQVGDIDVKVGNEWKSWYDGTMKQMYGFQAGRLESFRDGTFLKIKVDDYAPVFLDLKGSSNALKSL